MMRLAPLFLVALLFTGCTASREAIISRTSTGLVAARSAFTAEDERQQLAIVEAGPNRAAVEAQLAAHRQARNAATKAFQAAWAALAVASLQPTDANIARLAQLAAVAVSSIEKEVWP